MVERGTSLVGAFVLSLRDNPALNSVDAVMDALPPSVRVMVIEHIEYLLPASQRSVRSVLRLVSRLRTLARMRGIIALAGTGYSPEELRRAEAI